MTLYVIKYFRHGCILCACMVMGINILTSCKSKDTNRNLHPYENKLGIKPASLAQIDTINFTTIEWINPVQNFGILKYGDSAVIKFRFKNTGVHPLFLSRVQPSCGCTVAHYREEAIMPGEEDELTVIFNTIGQGSEVHKTVSVTTNTSNGVQHLLTFEGRVNR